MAKAAAAQACLTQALIPSMWNVLSYYWLAARGFRLHPWDSPYLRWRLETFLGAAAEYSSALQFLKILWTYRHQMQNFVDWAAERRRRQFQSRA